MRRVCGLLHNPPFFVSLFGRLEPLPIRAFTGRTHFTVASAHSLFDSSLNCLTTLMPAEFGLLISRHDKTRRKGGFACLVEMRRVELLSENISAELSPSASDNLYFAFPTACQQADGNAIS